MPGGKPLPKRRNIVITKNPDYKCEGAEVVHSIEEAVNIAEPDAFVIGGAEIYAQMLNFLRHGIHNKGFSRRQCG